MTKRLQHITTILLLMLTVCSGKAWGQWTDTNSGVTFTVVGGLEDKFPNATYETATGPTYACDGKTDTKLCVKHKNIEGDTGTPTEQYPDAIILKSDYPIYVKGYSITTGNDTQTYWGRNPKSWVLYGADSQSGPWTPIHSVTDDNTIPHTNFTETTFNLTSQCGTAYQYFKYAVTNIWSTNKTTNHAFTQYSEFHLFGNLGYTIHFVNYQAGASVSVANDVAAGTTYNTDGAAVTTTKLLESTDITVNDTPTGYTTFIDVDNENGDISVTFVNRIVIQSVSDDTKFLASPHANSAVLMSPQFGATVFELEESGAYYFLKENASETYWWVGQPNSTTNGVNMVAEDIKNKGYSGLFSIIKENSAYTIQDQASSGSKYYLTLSGNTAVGNSTGTGDASKWYIHLVTPYTVNITGATSGTVTFNGTNLYGAAQTQSDGGKYYFEGEPVAGDFTAGAVTNYTAGTVAVDNTAHTITLNYTAKCANPTITRNGNDFTFTCSFPTSGVTIKYTTDGSDPVSGTNYSGTAVHVDNDKTLKIIAMATDYDNSDVVEYFVSQVIGSGTEADPFIIANASQLNDIKNNLGSYYRLDTDIDASGFTGVTGDFTGSFDGNFKKITGLQHPLFTSVTGTVKNVTLDNVTISGDGNAGAIANEASGNARIYNCQVLASDSKDFIANRDNEDKPFSSRSTVSGSGAVGGIVGLISGNARVINCVSYADVSGGTYGAGIVGQYSGTWITNTGTTVDDNGIIVMNCLMLGNVKSGSTQMSPVVGGSGVTGTISTWDYFRYASMTNAQNMTTAQNGAIAIDEDRWLNRWQFHRAALNNHRNLAAVYCFNDASRMNEIAKWTVDESISRWPILKAHDSNTRKTLDRTIPNTTDDYAGRQLGTLPVTVKIVGAGNTEYSYNANLPITDMDTLRYDYTCGKVILPFANEFTGWTPQTTTSTDYGRIIIGWEITSLTGGTEGTFSDYNFADRNCTAKDVYHATNNPFIYAQGGMFIVPNGVTAITITAHWANAFYLADEYYDVDISARTGSTQTGNLVYNAGKRTATKYNGKTIYTTLLSAQDKMTTDYLVHSQAVVLVGNYHSNDGNALRVGKGCTIMSIDEDCDQEPDYGFYNTEVGKTVYYKQFPATRWDFIPVFATGYFQMCNTRAMEFSCAKAKGWWEFTETSLMRSFELQAQDAFHQNNDNGKGNNAYILNGGCHQQFIRGRGGNMAKLSYVRVGGTAYVKEFFQGNHSNDKSTMTIRPIIVTGGEIEKCYMTGQVIGPYINQSNNNVRFYCSGGKIDKYLSCYMEYPIQDVNVHIDHALINKFYGGGTTQVGRVLGNINVDIKNSYVEHFCGGPEFGDMESGKTVTVNAENTTFGNYYGAGYGGTALTRVKSARNGGEQGNAADASSKIDDYYNYYRKYNSTYNGIGTSYEVEEFMNAYGWYYFRFYNYVANLDLASTGDVTSKLTDCKILNDFYGGGCQGKVNGTINSTLTNCNVVGSVFGGGYKTAATEVDVYERLTEWPLFDTVYGIFDPVKYPTPTPYKWEYVETMPSQPYGTNANGENVLYTTTKTSEMGVVTGAIDLTITNGTVGKNVFGGGNESLSKNNTSVKILGNADIGGNVYGGGNAAEVQGTTKVQIGEECE